eukprot:CAMPEP_0198595202 /NCGR_PEP_ID=MMETSP1462-20131121/141596_1 /TAXON_ID=1333877 /ORGANISM="Brandtodinium nutriculum, Strain RCC3387" /LENGTH=69 /DNA_ID=CAMNT_0044326831 /DNA_START=39 /DNA_END=244 /DNA_ORIENTATION=-
MASLSVSDAPCAIDVMCGSRSTSVRTIVSNARGAPGTSESSSCESNASNTGSASLNVSGASCTGGVTRR